MNIGNLKYLLKEGLRNLWTNRLMTLASVGVLTACLLLIGCAILFSDNINSVVGYVEDQNEIVVFLEKENTEEENAAIGTRIKEMADVESVTYTSKEQAWEIQKEKLGAAAALLEENGDNPYYAYFTVRENDLSKINETTAALSALEGVKQVNSSNEFAMAVISLRRMVSVFGGILILALVLVSLVIIANTIRAAVFSRRKEINIMKYVGATNGFIRLPFLVEGVALGFLSAVIAFLLCWLCYALLVSSLTGNSGTFLAAALENILPFSAVAGKLALLFFGAGTVTGTLGSLISVRNHLKV